MEQNQPTESETIIDLYYDNGEPDEIIDLKNWFKKDYDAIATYRQVFPTDVSAAEGFLYNDSIVGETNLKRSERISRKELLSIPCYPKFISIYPLKCDSKIRVNTTVDYISVFYQAIYIRPPPVKPAIRSV